MINNSFIYAINDYAESVNNAEALQALYREAEQWETLTIDGLRGIGEMLSNLGIFADEKGQNVSNEAISNETARDIGGLLMANSYLLRVLNETKAAATFERERLEKAEKSNKNHRTFTANVQGGKPCAN